MVHSRPLPCPNRATLDAADHDPGCNECHNGYIYYAHKPFVGVIMQNNMSRQHLPQGSYDLDSAVVLVPTHYTDGTELDVQVFDQISVPDFTVRYYQLVEHSQSGVDRLHFPAVSIDRVIGPNFSEYLPGVDVVPTQDGRVKWISSNRPPFNLDIGDNGTGGIYAINYYTKPLFTIVALPHQLRATQTVKEGKTVSERFPQLAMCRKDFIPYSYFDKRAASDTPSPRDGQL